MPKAVRAAAAGPLGEVELAAVSAKTTAAATQASSGKAVKRLDDTPADSAPDDRQPTFAGADDDTFGFLSDSPAPQSKSTTRAASAASIADGAMPGDVLGRSGIGGRPSTAGHGHSHVRKKKKNSAAVWAIGAIVGSLVIAAVVVAVVLTRANNTGGSAAADPKKNSTPMLDPSVPMLSFTFKCGRQASGARRRSPSTAT